MKKRLVTIFGVIYYMLPRVLWPAMFLFGLISYLTCTSESVLTAIIMSAVISAITSAILIFTIKLIIGVVKQDIEFNKQLERIRNIKAHRD